MGVADVVRYIFETNVVSPKNCYELAHNRINVNIKMYTFGQINMYNLLILNYIL